MNSPAPRTAREALIAEVLGDLDTLLDRVEKLPALMDGSGEKIAATIKILEEAGDKYRMAVTAFNEQAKADLSEYFDRKASQVAASTCEEQRAIIQEIARTAFQTVATDRAEKLGLTLSQAAKDFRRSWLSRMMENGATALISSGLTAGLVYALLKLH